MGAPELVPFSDQADARQFVALYGGQVMRLDDVGDALILSNAPVIPPKDTRETAIVPDDDDYRARLEKLRKE
mgnify:FL=1